MIQFLKCELSCTMEFAEKRQDEIIVLLNNKFGSLSCDCHPKEIWKIAVDLDKDCKIKFHKTHFPNPNCRIFEKKYQDDICNFIETLE